jgi:HSP20 family protein
MATQTQTAPKQQQPSMQQPQQQTQQQTSMQQPQQQTSGQQFTGQHVSGQQQEHSAWDDWHAELQRSLDYIGGIPQEGQGRFQQGGGGMQQWQQGGGGGYNPFRELIRMQRRLDHLIDQSFDFPFGGVGFGGFGNLPMLQQQQQGGRGRQRGALGGQLTIPRPLADWHPVVEVKETDKDIVIHAELPGVEKDKVKLDVQNNMLILSGERSFEKKSQEKEKFFVTERAYGSFSRAIALPEGVDTKSIQANYKDGILEVVVPKPQKAITDKSSIQIK